MVLTVVHEHKNMKSTLSQSPFFSFSLFLSLSLLVNKLHLIRPCLKAQPVVAVPSRVLHQVLLVLVLCGVEDCGLGDLRAHVFLYETVDFAVVD